MVAKLREALKLIPFFMAFLLCGNAQAQLEGNWLMGLYGGFAQRYGNVEVDFDHPLGTSIFIRDHKDVGLLGGLLGGYQARCHDWLLGAELNIEWQELNKDHHAAFTAVQNIGFNLTTNYKQNMTAGISGRFGYEMFPNFLPYVRLGVQSSRDKLIVLGTSSDFEESIDIESIRRVYRLTGGFGAEFPVCYLMGLSVRTEYNFRARAGSIKTTELAEDGLTTATLSARPKANVFLVAVVLNFI